MQFSSANFPDLPAGPPPMNACPSGPGGSRERGWGPNELHFWAVVLKRHLRSIRTRSRCSLRRSLHQIGDSQWCWQGSERVREKVASAKVVRKIYTVLCTSYSRR